MVTFKKVVNERYVQRWNPGAGPAAHGVSLIELLVTSAIIAVVASIVFPVFNRAAESSRRSTCWSNLSRLSRAFQHYTNDHNGYFPLISFDDYHGTPIGWAYGISAYTRNQSVFQCPGEPNPVGVTDDAWPANEYPTNYNYSDYYYNNNFNWQVDEFGNWSNTHGAISMRSLAAPAKTVLIGDGHNGGWSYTYFQPEERTGEYWAHGILRANETSQPLVRHRGAAHYGFADGHVKWLAPKAISGGSMWDPEAKPASPGKMGKFYATFAYK